MIEIRNKPNGDRAVFAVEKIPSGTFLGLFHGPIKIFPRDPATGVVDYGSTDGGFVLDLHLGHDRLIGMIVGYSGQVVDYINHKCDPNVEVAGPHKLAVQALRDIEPEEELLLDYTTFTLLPVGIKCWCDHVSEHNKCLI